MATKEFIPVAGDDWYQRRRQDAEGEFFRKISDQAGRGSAGASGGSTRQGIYCFTAGGRLLAFKNAGQNPEVMRNVLGDAIRQWQQLPETERRPGAVVVGKLDNVDSRYTRNPPAGALIFNVFTRALDRDASGNYCDAECKVGDEAARDHLWLTNSEWKSLIPASAHVGARIPFPASAVERICRFHLTDNTRGEPSMWSRAEVHKSRIVLIVQQVSPSGVTLRLEGEALLANDAEPARANRGFDVQLAGHVNYDSAAKSFTRFDVVATGDHWGEGPYTRAARPGRAPLGIAMELTPGIKASDRIPPQGAREISEYLSGTR
jgi:hypothetical protein